MTICQTCPRSLRPDETHRTACHRCEDQLRAWLRELPLQLPLLAASLQRDRQGVATSHHGAGRAHAPAPAREDVLSLLGPAAPGTVHASLHGTEGDQTGTVPLHAVLHAWAEQVADERHEPLPPARAGELRTGYLTAHLPYALRRPWYAFMHTEIADLVRQVRAITRTRPRRHALPAPCPGPDCQTFALIEEDWQTYIVCQACGRLLTRAEYEEHAAAVMPPLVRTALLLAATEAAATHPEIT